MELSLPPKPAVEALKEKERRDGAKFTTKIDGKTSLGPIYFDL